MAVAPWLYSRVTRRQSCGRVGPHALCWRSEAIRMDGSKIWWNENQRFSHFSVFKCENVRERNVQFRNRSCVVSPVEITMMHLRWWHRSTSIKWLFCTNCNTGRIFHTMKLELGKNEFWLMCEKNCTMSRFLIDIGLWVKLKSEVCFVSDFNSETSKRPDVPTSGLKLALTFGLFFQIQLSPKTKSGTVSILN